MGPVQILVVGYGPDADFKGEALDELKRLAQHDVVRLVDLLAVHRNADDSVDKIEIGDIGELIELGATAGALIGLGAAGEAGMEAGALAGAEAGASGSLYDDAEVWAVADAIPAGMTAVIAVLEHRWAIPLRDAIVRSGGVALADEWLHPEDMIAIGMIAGEEAGA